MGGLRLEKYTRLLKQYLTTEAEEALYKADQFSKHSLQKKYSPPEIVQIHMESLMELYPKLSKEMKLSLDFLLQTMISYGVAHQEFQVLREEQKVIKSELDIAAKMQKTLLKGTIPKADGIQIGVISKPAKKMSGDYYQFVQSPQGQIGMVIADIIGKGIPAALCMYMIKYALDSFPENIIQPDTILKLLNRVVEANVEPGMFVTMFYGFYNPENHIFSYSSAGHEPGFFYHAKTNTFEEIDAKGIVLGVKKEVTYPSYSKKLKPGDMVFLLTDGVTECRINNQFIERDEVKKVIQKYIHLHPEELVEKVFSHFEQLEDFKLEDDFTLIALRKDK
jgi:phosphoserine phosphatase RsbU/P